MSGEFSQRAAWERVGNFQVNSELFLDVVFTSLCDCACPFCIARTKEFAREDRAAWERGLEDAFRLFRIRDVIILGGEATIDPDFFGKLAFLVRVLERHPVDRLILTTNGVKLRDPAFLSRLLASPIDAVNLSRMHHDQWVNDRVFGQRTLTKDEIQSLYGQLKARGKTLRLNVNVWRGNLDSPGAMDAYVKAFAGCCDAVKFTPLMATDMFGACQDVTAFTRKHAIPEGEIAALWESFLRRHGVTRRAGQVLGFVDYAEAAAFGQRVILKYAQVEDKYDRDAVIPP